MLLSQFPTTKYYKKNSNFLSHLRRVPGVPADAALPPVGPPLPGEPAAVELVVVVVGRGVEAVAPHGGAGRGLDQATVRVRVRRQAR